MKSIVLILKIILSLVLTWLISGNYTPAQHTDVIAISGPLASVASMLFGFTFAIVMFLSSSESLLIKNMKNTNMHQALLEQLHATGGGLIISSVLMIVSIFSPHKNLNFSLLANYTWDYIFLLLGFTALIYSLIEFWLTWSKVKQVIKNM